MAPRLTIKDLQAKLSTSAAEVAQLKSSLEESEANRILAETDLAEAQEKIQQQAAALTDALARAQVVGSANADGEQAPQVERPKPSTKGGRIPIQEAMGLDGKDELYGSIQKYIHVLVPTCGIDWKRDFRLQSADNLSKLYRAARKEFPVLKQFKNDWATAELLKMYLQNSREHARTRGYLPRAGRKGASPRGSTGTSARRENNENVQPQAEAGVQLQEASTSRRHARRGRV